jgi:hypothetical protein
MPNAALALCGTCAQCDAMAAKLHVKSGEMAKVFRGEGWAAF